MVTPRSIVIVAFLMMGVPVIGAVPSSGATLWDGRASAPSGDDAQGMVLADTATKTRRQSGLRRTGLPLPRFASLRSSKVNLRAGPGVRYPVEWVYQRRGLPMKIIAEFDAWRKVRDWRGTVGWIHRAMLTGKRTVISIAPEVVLRRKPARSAPAVARTEAGVVSRILTCEADWCRIQAGGISGWGRRNALWGTLPAENIN
jgi:SH3-like domain-containing protein